MRKQVSFKVESHEGDLIQQIVNRAESVARAHAIPFDRMGACMDVTACHANGNRLRLVDFLGADDFNFAHDFFGIQRHINRETGEMEDFFSPRFTQSEA